MSYDGDRDSKHMAMGHHEDMEMDRNVATKEMGFVADTLAADYVDPTVVITPEENKRLRRLIFTR